MAYLPYGDEWRIHRRMAYHALSPSAVLKYQPIQADLAAILCKDIMDRPTEFVHHIRLLSGRIIATITYGIRLDEADKVNFNPSSWNNSWDHR